MKAVLVPVEQHAFMRSVLDVALLVADRFGSHVEGLALGPDIPDAGTFDIPASWTVPSETEQRDMVERARHLFENFMASCAIPIHSEASEGVSYGWAGTQLFGESRIGSIGRVFDLMVLGRPGQRHELPRMTTVEAALFESGRPVLLVPPSSPGSIGETIVIAWNGSTETARTVALGMPMLSRAQRVFILTVEGWRVDGPTGDELAARLQRHNIPAEVISRNMQSRTPGEVILEQAGHLRADLLFKGAYTQSRLRQMIFGGATTHILTHSRLPIFMAH